jgi:hypothetical protein
MPKNRQRGKLPKKCIDLLYRQDEKKERKKRITVVKSKRQKKLKNVQTERQMKAFSKKLRPKKENIEGDS